MPKRKDRVAPPPAGDQWDILYLTNEAVDGWEDLCRAAPGPTNACWESLRSAPMKPRNPARQHQLKGANLGERDVEGRKLEQWQYEVTGSGRVWYCPDPSKTIVWITYASAKHPKAIG
jgi:hypothetical protein